MHHEHLFGDALRNSLNEHFLCNLISPSDVDETPDTVKTNSVFIITYQLLALSKFRLPDKIRLYWPNSKFLVLGGDQKAVRALRSLKLTFIKSESTLLALIDTIEGLNKGESIASTVDSKNAKPSNDLKLSTQQKMIVELLNKNFTTKAIAQELGITPSSVSNQLSRMRKKMGVKDNTELRFAVVRQLRPVSNN